VTRGGELGTSFAKPSAQWGGGRWPLRRQCPPPKLWWINPQRKFRNNRENYLAKFVLRQQLVSCKLMSGQGKDAGKANTPHPLPKYLKTAAVSTRLEASPWMVIPTYGTQARWRLFRRARGRQGTQHSQTWWQLSRLFHVLSCCTPSPDNEQRSACWSATSAFHPSCLTALRRVSFPTISMKDGRVA